MSRDIGLIFPGQGSQHLGMLTPDLISNYKDIIQESSDLLDFDFIKLINEDPSNKLNKTSFTQPALLLTSYLHFLNFKDITNIKPFVVAGHSLGEYTALVASNSIDFFDALNLVRNRGVLMADVGGVDRFLVPADPYFSSNRDLTSYCFDYFRCSICQKWAVF